MPSNNAAWLVGKKVHPLEIRPAPYTPPKENEIVVKTGAIAINPVDWATQALAIFEMEYPRINGNDIAGVVYEVGSSVTRFKPGDRVTGLPMGWVTSNNSEGSFQEYTVILEKWTTQIPDTISLEQACVLPVCFSTAATGLFDKEYLGLDLPSLDVKPNGKTVLVWGGASSVGSNAIQLAVNAGYEVFTTASSKNFDYVKRLGASQAFDYKNDNVVEEVIEALKGKQFAGAYDAITMHGAFEKCVEIVSKTDGVKFIPTVQPVKTESPIKNKFIMYNHEGSISTLWKDFLYQAMARGKFVPAPEPEVVGKGLEFIQVGLDRYPEGVSAKKIVVTL